MNVPAGDTVSAQQIVSAFTMNDFRLLNYRLLQPLSGPFFVGSFDTNAAKPLLYVRLQATVGKSVHGTDP